MTLSLICTVAVILAGLTIGEVLCRIFLKD